MNLILNILLLGKKWQNNQGFGFIVGTLAVQAEYQINNGDAFNVKSIIESLDDSYIKNLFENSKMQKDKDGKIWFISTNSSLVGFITSMYFNKKTGTILNALNESMSRDDLIEKLEKIHLSRATIYRKFNELILLGLIVQNKNESSPTQKRSNPYCRLFDEIYCTRTTKSKIKCAINKKILQKEFWENWIH